MLTVNGGVNGDAASAERRETSTPGDVTEGDDGDAPITLPSLVCDTCAARNFPETSVRPEGEVRFRYGDDGPVTAIDLALEIPGIQVLLQSSGGGGGVEGEA